jgi:hypothetical protein
MQGTPTLDPQKERKTRAGRVVFWLASLSGKNFYADSPDMWFLTIFGLGYW